MPPTITPELTETWLAELDAMDARLAPHFGRSEVCRRASAYLRGLLSGVDRNMGGSSPRSPGMRRRMACNTCWVARSGMPRRFGTNCEGMCVSGWAIRMRCW